jgi:hypothetical protein
MASAAPASSTTEASASKPVEAPAPAAASQGNGKALAPATQAAPRAPTMRLDIEPQTIDEAWRLAQYIASSDLVPKAYKDRPQDIIIAIKKGKEVGLPAMAAIHNIVVMNGRPELWGEGLMGVIVASPFYRDHDEFYLVGGERREFLLSADLTADDTTAVTTFWRSDNPRPKTATYSIANAKKAGLWTKQGPWQSNPDRMLRYRARGFAAGDCFADVLTGVQRPGWGPVGAPPTVVLDTPAREVRRISESKPEPAATGSAAAPVTDAPKTEEVTLGPVGVLTVQQFMGGFSIALSDGSKVDTTELADALEIEKVIGTKHKFVLTCERATDGNLQLKSFRIAE